MKNKVVACTICLFLLFLLGCNRTSAPVESGSSNITQPHLAENFNPDMENNASDVSPNASAPDIEEEITIEEVAENLDIWIGKYKLFEDYENSGFGDMIMRTLIEIDKDDSGYYANVYQSGHMTDRRIRAAIIGNEERIDIYFDEWIEYPSTAYTAGDLLFTLYIKDEILHTSWGEMGPLIEQDNGIYFERITEEEYTAIINNTYY